MFEKRLTTQLRKYWMILRGNRTFPEIQRLNPAAIEWLWPQCFLLSCHILRENFSYRYDYVGQEITDFYERDMNGLYVEDAIQENVHLSLSAALQQVAAHFFPIDKEGNFLKYNGKLIKYRMALFPFGNDERMTHILAGLSFTVISRYSNSN